MSIIDENYSRWLSSPVVSSDDKTALEKMNDAEKGDAFFKNIEFGTAGMRGVLGPGTNRMNAFTVKKACVAFGELLLQNDPANAQKGVVISHDNRFCSREFAEQCAKILNQMGIDAYLFDSLRPTPELSYGVRYVKAAGGIMITASHNPKEWNGFKVYDEKGCQLVPNKIRPMLDLLAALPNELEVQVPTGSVSGKTVILPPQVDDDYVKAVEGCQETPDLPKENFKIVYTPQHGTSYENAMRVFQDCGYDIHPVTAQCVHDPAFGATLSPNPEADEAYIEPIKLAKEIDADLIVMTDPDGDRCGLAYKSKNGTYERLTGNQSAALLIDYLLSERKEKGTLHKNGVLYDTIVTSALGRKIAESYGLSVESFYTGFKYIGDRISHYEDLGKGPVFEFGYEESYGCLIQPFVRDKDGIQAILLYCEMALSHKLAGETLDVAYENLGERFGHYDTITASVAFGGSEGDARMKAMMANLHKKAPAFVGDKKVVRVEDYLKGESFDDKGSVEKLPYPPEEVVRLFLEDGSWVAVRPSGTEPKCKFYVETVSSSSKGLRDKTLALSKAVQQAVGAIN